MKNPEITIDYHVNIGQFNRTYYPAGSVFETLRRCGILEAWVMNTTSGTYFPRLSTPADTLGLHKKILSQNTEAKEYADRAGLKAHFLYWVVPKILEDGVTTVSDAMKEFCYEGFKLNPRGQPWDTENSSHRKILDEVFSYAGEHKMPVWIHTGFDGIDSPERFLEWIEKFKDVRIVMCHCRQAERLAEIMRKNPQVRAENSFAGADEIRFLQDAGFGSRILFGTDTPCDHYWTKVHGTEYENADVTAGADDLTEIYSQSRTRLNIQHI